MRHSIELAHRLNTFGIKPESGAPMMITDKGAAQWDVAAQCWMPVAA